MSGEQAYSAIVDARVERAPGVDGLLLKEKLGGKSVISHSLDRFDEDARCSQIIVLVAPALREWMAGDPLTFASPKLKLVDHTAGCAAALALVREPVVVYQDAARPNWQPALLDSLLRQWQPGGAVLPAQPLDPPLVRWSSDTALVAEATTATTDIFGNDKPATATHLRHIAGFEPAVHLCLLETPQVYDTAALRSALAAHPASAELAEACHSAGGPLLLIPARAHNLALRNGDDLHLLRRLLGEPKKGGKDRYGGLGW